MFNRFLELEEKMRVNQLGVMMLLQRKRLQDNRLKPKQQLKHKKRLNAKRGLRRRREGRNRLSRKSSRGKNTSVKSRNVLCSNSRTLSTNK